MALIIKDRVMESSSTTGTGAMTLAGAYTGFRSFSSVCSTNDTCYYIIEAVDSNGVPTGDWETGLGTYSAANTLTRTTVLDSSNSGSAVSFAAGTKRVAISVIASNIAIGADPTATASDTVVNGSASTFMRSDAAPAIQKGSSSQFGVVKVDGTTITASGGVISAVGGSGSSWSLVGSWTWSTSVANVDFTGLSGYSDFLVIFSSFGTGAAAIPSIQFSTNNGTSYYSGASDYQHIAAANGTVTGVDRVNVESSLTTGSKSAVAYIMAANATNGPKAVHLTRVDFPYVIFAADNTHAINALRILASSGANLTSGSVYIYGR